MTDVRRFCLVAVALVALLASCGGSDAEPQAIAPVYAQFAGYAPGEPVTPEMQACMKVLGESDPSAVAASAAVRVFAPDADSVFPSLRPLELALGGMLASAAEQGLELPVRRYGAVVWGRPESIVFCDSVMLVALNHYLGADYPGYSHLEAYRRAPKTPAQLPYDMAEALVATSFPFEGGESPTVLARLLYEGALAEARLRLAGGSPADALGYTDEEYGRLKDSEADLWRALVAGRMLYSTLPLDAARLVSPAPATAVLSPRAPGRAGRFIGHQMVRAYLASHPQAGLRELLSPAFYMSEATLRESGYAPR